MLILRVFLIVLLIKTYLVIIREESQELEQPRFTSAYYGTTSNSHLFV